MNFCPNCNNILDCIKSVNIVSEKKIIKKSTDLFKLIENNVNLVNYKAEFNKFDLLENKKYIKYDDDLKHKISLLFDNQPQLSTSAEYKCINCGYTKPIIETSRLYINNVNNNNYIITKSLEENELYCTDPLLPHTKDYICKNPNCITHKQSDLKNSVFYKDKNSYKINYICCICFYNW